MTTTGRRRTGLHHARHFILTRFAVAMPAPYVSRTDDDAWLDRRLELLRSIASPSLAGQTVPITWLIGIDASVATSVVDAVRSAARETDAHVIRTDGQRLPWREAVSDFLYRNTSGAVITTRMDSDDAIASDFAEHLREVAEPLPVSFVNGAQLDLRTGQASHLREPSNPFLSLISLKGQTILDAIPRHDTAMRVRPDLVLIDGPPAWLQVVHGGNLANFVFRHQKPIPASEVVERFALLRSSVPKETSLSLARRQLGFMVRRSLRPLSPLKSAAARLCR